MWLHVTPRVEQLRPIEKFSIEKQSLGLVKQIRLNSSIFRAFASHNCKAIPQMVHAY